MKQLVILGNWKANKTIEEAKQWIEEFSSQLARIPEPPEIILCPAFHHLTLFAATVPVSLGVQDLSPFGSGAYTGEISASMLPKTIKYALLGHSERRKYFGETDEIVVQKVQQSLKLEIRPIVCISDIGQASKIKTLVPDFSSKGMILYEPLFAIGSGNADTPQNANTTASQIISVLGTVPILYGGSVKPENVKEFIKQEFLSGVGVGGASLKAETFAALITNAR